MRTTRLLARLGPGPHTISPTAFYTGAVWQANGLGDKALGLPLGPLGALGYAVGQAAMLPVEAAGGPTLPQVLLARHRLIDHLLEGAVRRGEVGQVVELAAGLSPRGLRFRRDHPDLTYVEADLPAMAERKRRALSRAGALGEHHRVVPVDVFGPGLDELFTTLDPTVGTAVVTEGLLNYFPTADVRRLWGRLAVALADLPRGLYLSDLHVAGESGRAERLFVAGLGLAVRSRVHLHFASSAAAEDALREAGFGTATLHRPPAFSRVLPGMDTPGAARVRVVEARTT